MSVFHIHDVTDAIFCDFNLCGERVTDKALEAFHAFLQAYLCIAALIDAADHDTVLCQHLFHKRKDRRLQTIDPKRQGFHHQHVGELVHYQPRQPVCFPEDQSAASCVHGRFAVFPCIAHPLFQKFFCDLMFFSAAHHPDRNFGTGIDKAPSQKETIKILYRKNISVFIVSLNAINLVVVNPGAAAFKRASFALLQNGFCVHISSQSAAWRLRKR